MLSLFQLSFGLYAPCVHTHHINNTHITPWRSMHQLALTASCRYTCMLDMYTCTWEGTRLLPGIRAKTFSKVWAPCISYIVAHSGYLR